MQQPIPKLQIPKFPVSFNQSDCFNKKQNKQQRTKPLIPIYLKNREDLGFVILESGDGSGEQKIKQKSQITLNFLVKPKGIFQGFVS